MRDYVLLGALVVSGCSSPACPTPAAAISPVAAAPASERRATTTCRKRSVEQARILDEIYDSLRQPDAGGYRKEHAEFFRFMPTLHESGMLASIGPTFTKDGENPIFAVTLLVRNASGTMDANLGFAAMPCPEGDLALIAPLVPLGTAAGAIHWTRRIPMGSGNAAQTLTELEIEVGDAPAVGIGQPQPVMHTRSIVVGPKPGAKIGVIGVVGDLDAELAPQEGIRRSEERLFGSGWYAHRGGASYLWVHRVGHNRDDLCKAKKTQRPPSPPLLRLVAHVDPKAGFTTEPSALGVGFVMGIGENQPPEGVSQDKEFTFRVGPTAMADRYAEQGPPAQLLYGIFESAEAARARAATLKYAKASIFSTEPPSGATAAKEPWTIPVKASAKTLQVGCLDYL